MHFQGKRIEDLDENHIRSLLENKVPESQTLDYKLKLPGDTDREKKEFLADLSSLANTSGGVIIFGVEEERDGENKNTGFPGALPGLGKINIDAEKLRLENIVRDGLLPRLPHLVLKNIIFGDRKSFLIIAVSKSFAAPHVVWFRKNGKYHKRNSSGKYQTDPDELRRMFIETSDWQRDIESFRGNRISKVCSFKFLSNLNLVTYGAALIHILPIGRLFNLVDVISQKTKLFTAISPFSPGQISGRDYRPNLDGLLVFTPSAQNRIQAYVQWLRNGGVEAYTTSFHYGKKDEVVINAYGINKYVQETCWKAIQTMKNVFDIHGPYAACLYVSGLMGKKIYIAPGGELGLTSSTNEFLEEEVRLPPVLIEDIDSEDQVIESLRPLLDMFWQSAGFLKAHFN